MGPRPLSAVSTMKCAPWVRLKITVAQRTSSIVHASWVSLVKKPRIFETQTALRRRAVYKPKQSTAPQ